MHTINVKTATRESAEQFKTDKFQRYWNLWQASSDK